MLKLDAKKMAFGIGFLRLGGPDFLTQRPMEWLRSSQIVTSLARAFHRSTYGVVFVIQPYDKHYKITLNPRSAGSRVESFKV